MANIKGKEIKDLSLIVTVNPKRATYTKDGSIAGYYTEIQIDQSEMDPKEVAEKGGADPNPYLASKERPRVDGKGTYVDHGDFYWTSQLNSMSKGAGPNAFEMEDGLIVMGVRGDLTVSKDKLVLASVNGPTNNPNFDNKILDRQKAVTQSMKSFRDKEVAKKAEAKQNQNQAETKDHGVAFPWEGQAPAKDAEGPTFG